MADYKYALSETVAETAFDLRSRERITLVGLFHEIAMDPHLEGDFVDHDDTSRPLQVKLFGQWLITWWPDHLSSEVRIVDVAKV